MTAYCPLTVSLPFCNCEPCSHFGEYCDCCYSSVFSFLIFDIGFMRFFVPECFEILVCWIFSGVLNWEKLNVKRLTNIFLNNSFACLFQLRKFPLPSSFVPLKKWTFYLTVCMQYMNTFIYFYIYALLKHVDDLYYIYQNDNCMENMWQVWGAR